MQTRRFGVSTARLRQHAFVVAAHVARRRRRRREALLRALGPQCTASCRHARRVYTAKQGRSGWWRRSGWWWRWWFGYWRAFARPARHGRTPAITAVTGGDGPRSRLPGQPRDIASSSHPALPNVRFAIRAGDDPIKGVASAAGAGGGRRTTECTTRRRGRHWPPVSHIAVLRSLSA